MTAIRTPILQTLATTGLLDHAVAVAAEYDMEHTDWHVYGYTIGHNTDALVEALTDLAWANVFAASQDIADNAGNYLDNTRQILNTSTGERTGWEWEISDDRAVRWDVDPTRTGDPLPRIDYALVDLDTEDITCTGSWLGDADTFRTLDPRGLVTAMVSLADQYVTALTN